MDPDVIKDIVYGVILAGGLAFKSWRDRKNAKKDNQKQLDDHATGLKRDLDLVAQKLAEETARLIADREARDAEAKRLQNVRKGIEFTEQVDREVRHAIDKIKNEYRAQRAYVIEFSNGNVTESGIHLMRITFMHEVVERYDVEKISQHFKERHMPEMFKSPMKLVLLGSLHYIKDVEEMDLTEMDRRDYYNWLAAYKVRSTMWKPLRVKGKVIAILVIHWFASTHFDDQDIARIKDMKDEIEKIYEKVKGEPEAKKK